MKFKNTYHKIHGWPKGLRCCVFIVNLTENRKFQNSKELKKISTYKHRLGHEQNLFNS